ncbi:MAG: hypothetical protein ACRCYP_06215 [Alphaproteobacteria bacterium]
MKKILNMIIALLGSVALSPELYAATTDTTVTEAGRPAVALHNADGTRPRISFQPISGALKGDYTLVQVDENNQQTPILKLTIQRTIEGQKITEVKTLLENEEDEGISLAGGVWRLNRDQQTPENPKGTKIKPGNLVFVLMVNEKFGIPLSLGPKAWSHQRTSGGKTEKLDALNFDLNSKNLLVKYASMGEAALPSQTAFFFDRKAHGFLDNAPLLEKVAQAIEGYEKFLSQRNMYMANDAGSVKFSATLNQRNIFLFGLAKSYLQNLFKEAANQNFLNLFKTMPDPELKKLAGSSVSWFQEATVLGRRILTETEKNTFVETIFSALKTLQTEMAQTTRITPPKPAAIETQPSAPQTQPAKAVKPTNKVQKLRNMFEGKSKT